MQANPLLQLMRFMTDPVDAKKRVDFLNGRLRSLRLRPALTGLLNNLMLNHILVHPPFAEPRN